ncbi:MAG: hypothetical protein AVDCRST_MAG68-3681, partial [uncultured Gemmatimonadetes bacterium]
EPLRSAAAGGDRARADAAGAPRPLAGIAAGKVRRAAPAVPADGRVHPALRRAAAGARHAGRLPFLRARRDRGVAGLRARPFRGGRVAAAEHGPFAQLPSPRARGGRRRRGGSVRGRAALRAHRGRGGAAAGRGDDGARGAAALGEHRVAPARDRRAGSRAPARGGGGVLLGCGARDLAAAGGAPLRQPRGLPAFRGPRALADALPRQSRHRGHRELPGGAAGSRARARLRAAGRVRRGAGDAGGRLRARALVRPARTRRAL